jgi:hypothetical protein
MNIGNKIYVEIKSPISVPLYLIVRNSTLLGKTINISIRNPIVNSIIDPIVTNVKL